eukprot:TRINITY_DN12936_c0_g1_i1.p1 TRINITY_DN12936_c0_g1~~TRINITY_DN12936_c0_g1_i1.p1  ORF type:complete len:330 (-),score=74.20 TRINITY_DN12936_c0_g1_i1:47-1036(-)
MKLQEIDLQSLLGESTSQIDDDIYLHDDTEQETLVNASPWRSDPHYFKKVKISAVALLKMVMHSKTGLRPVEDGGDLEVMGIMQGKIQDNTMIVMDTFALPVKASAIRVNPMAESYEYIVQYISTMAMVGRTENVVGWYHSHPGYGCWLSGIDVNTQLTNQTYQEPFLAVVVDPTRTMSSGKVDIGAFRTYPRDYTPPDSHSEYQSVPLDMIEDFGVHANRYYQLEISVFKSSLDSTLFDLLWNKYWVSTLSSSPLLENKEFTARRFGDLAEKLDKAESKLGHSRMGSYFLEKKKEDSQMETVMKDSSKSAIEQVQSITSQVIKYNLFN